ncbi:hypothetical protein WJX84_000458, partial [Apatococcus fuscideae]
ILGLQGLLSELDEDSIDLLCSSYKANPSWSQKGEFRPLPPHSLTAGKVVIKLHTDKAPKAAENFKCLCTGERGKGKSSGKPLHFKGCEFHRIVKGFVCQGGDVVKGDGSGGDSIYVTLTITIVMAQGGSDSGAPASSAESVALHSRCTQHLSAKVREERLSCAFWQLMCCNRALM